MNDQITVDSNKMAEKLLNKLSVEIWNGTVNEARVESLEQQLKVAKEENLALKKELASLNDMKKG